METQRRFLLDRRQLLVALACAVLTACGVSGPGQSTAPPYGVGAAPLQPGIGPAPLGILRAADATAQEAQPGVPGAGEPSDLLRTNVARPAPASPSAAPVTAPPIRATPCTAAKGPGPRPRCATVNGG